MTDVELLPLPSPQVPFIDCDPSMTDIRRLVRWYEQGATEYARVNVSRATARLQAEIEALRAEVGELHMHAKRRDQYAVEKAAQALDWKKRAERLAAVLALLERSLAVIQHNIDEIGGCDHSVGICCCELIHLADDIRAALAQENRND